MKFYFECSCEESAAFIHRSAYGQTHMQKILNKLLFYLIVVLYCFLFQARRFFAQMISAVDFCHKHCVWQVLALFPSPLVIASPYIVYCYQFCYSGSCEKQQVSNELVSCQIATIKRLLSIISIVCGQGFYQSEEMMFEFTIIGHKCSKCCLSNFILFLLFFLVHNKPPRLETRKSAS